MAKPVLLLVDKDDATRQQIKRDLALGTTTEYLMRNSTVPVLVHH
jgi:nucleotide-binding universal stress UspA family protein